MFMMLFAVSIGSATEIMVAFHIGAGNYELVYRRLIRSLKIGLAGSLIIATIMACGFSGMLLDLFSNHSPQVAELAAPLILLSVMMEPGRAFNVIVINSLRAANDASFPMIMAILSMWCVAVPLEYFLGISMQMGLLGVWIAFTCDEWIRGISMYFRWKTRIWQRKSMNVSRETMLRQV
jgi:Na+-driven multidrug efflux pump